MTGQSYNDVLTFLHVELNQAETEESWKRRHDLLLKLSDILANRIEGSTLPRDFVERCKAILPDIVKAAGSERTTLSSQACRTIVNVAKNLETHMQSQLDIILPDLITLCGSTKNINQKNANEAILAICKHAGYSHRLFYHTCAAFKDKRIPPRTYAPEWLRLLLENYRNQMDHDKDGELARKAIYEGLRDSQPKVRENTRAAYWLYQKYDAQGARMIVGGLGTHAANALRDDPNNPDKPSKPAKVPSRPGSALAQIRAQSKQRMQHQAPQQQTQQPHSLTRGLTPASVKPDDFAFGSLKDLDHLTEKDKAMIAKQTTTSSAYRQKQEKTHTPHHSESSTSSRQGPPTQSRHQKTASRDNKVDAKDTKTSSPQVEAKSLMSAPIRRGRIVATPIAPAGSSRPGSRGEPVKKASETKDGSSGRQTPVSQLDKDVPSSVPSHHRKTASRQEAIMAEERGTRVGDVRSTKKTERHSPVIFEAPPLLPNTVPANGKKNDRQTPVIVEDNSASAPTTSKTPNEIEQNGAQSAPTATLQLRPVRPLAPENLASLPAERLVDRAATHQHVPEGKENDVVRPRSKKSPSRSPQRSSNRSPQRSPRRRNSISSAKRSLATAVEHLRHRNLDALGYRRLRKLIELHPHVLITRQTQFNELFELLVQNIGCFDELVESRDRRAVNLNHPVYNRHAMLIILIELFRQYPQWPEPQPGMTLCALLIARCNHSSGYAAVLQTIDDSSYLLCAHSQNPLPTIDAVLDTLEQIEYIITNNDPIITPQSTNTVFFNSLQSFVSDFAPERPRFATRLPIVMSFGVKLLITLLQRLVVCRETLYSIQEERLARFAEHLLTTYTILIKRQVMEYCTALHAVIKPEQRFYSYFSRESDKNLLHYYVAGSNSGLYAGAEPIARPVVSVVPDIEYMEPEPSTFDPGSEVSAQWKVVGDVVKERGLAQASAETLATNIGSGSSEFATSEESSNWKVLGTTNEE